MYEKECKWCKKLIIVEKQQSFASHVAGCKMNPNLEKNRKKLSDLHKGVLKVKRIVEKRNCLRCGEEFDIIATLSEIRNLKVKKYCSDKCARSRTQTKETKEKISNKLKGNTPHNKGKSSDKTFYTFICSVCNKEGINKTYNKNQKYHEKCWKTISGGIKNGSSRGKSGWYKGYWCDSSYELAFVIYNLEHSINIERNKSGFKYFYNNEEHLFYPDFIVEGKYTEVKNFRSELTDSKIKYFPHEIKVYYKDTIKPFLDYSTNKYGKNFINLYE